MTISSRNTKQGVRELRIIGGRWRSRKLSFDAFPGVRPTPDRVRETLFNWLQPWVSGSRCLDMFAGSGVLGFESLSRGASSVVFIDQQIKVVDRLREQANTFGSKNQRFICANAFHWLQQSPDNNMFDIIFIDPPFKQDLIQKSLACVEPHCSDSARIYIESEQELNEEDLQPGWLIEKSKKAASVYFHLLCRIDQG